ncbi:MAG: TIGR03086 family protein [Candidatus Aeolococcus gillhamiae]|uniref:TIGR03086 family protein n=1 Tax=Candidatus Aeolococcus gillhamiae TaxID=3127015 RepID=A0A2W5ZA12_9BACT|nr:MAG: TIGR03086 family protein [Candidatus Dormibacter sp. RRmetagenome_bin12]
MTNPPDGTPAPEPLAMARARSGPQRAGALMVLDDLRQVIDADRRLVEAILPWRLNDRTPCAGWDVQALLDHLVSVNCVYGALIRGDPPPRHDPRHVPRTGFGYTGGDLLEAFSAPGALQRGVATPLGELPGSVLAQHVVNELVVHGWDLARTLGQPTDLVPEVASHVLATLTEWKPIFRHLGEACQGDEQPAPHGAAALDRVAAILGRTV